MIGFGTFFFFLYRPSPLSFNNLFLNFYSSAVKFPPSNIANISDHSPFKSDFFHVYGSLGFFGSPGPIPYFSLVDYFEKGIRLLQSIDSISDKAS